MIYFIKSNSDHVKIGTSKRPTARLKNLQCGCPFPLEIIRTVKYAEESDLISRLYCFFRWQRENGEWFTFSDKIRGFIESFDPERFMNPTKIKWKFNLIKKIRPKSVKIKLPRKMPTRMFDPSQRELQDKFRFLGINSYKDLVRLVSCSESLAKQLWYGSKREGKPLPLSRQMANKIKEKTGASLDYLLS